MIKYCNPTALAGLNAILYQGANMTSNIIPNQKLTALFALQPCWQINTLADELECSIISVRRFLNKVGYYRSFTHNGTWYTLDSIPKFDRSGLWFSNKIGFSKVRNLNDTLIRLVHRSATGVTAETLGKILCCRCHSLLVHLCRRGLLQREKLGRSFIYFAGDSHIATSQRQAADNRNLEQPLIPAEIAVLILAAFIRNPEYNFEQLAKNLKKNKNVIIHATQIQSLFEQHGLKKTLSTVPQKHCGH
jgi:hypothetical protein